MPARSASSAKGCGTPCSSAAACGAGRASSTASNGPAHMPPSRVTRPGRAVAASRWRTIQPCPSRSRWATWRMACTVPAPCDSMRRARADMPGTPAQRPGPAAGQGATAPARAMPSNTDPNSGPRASAQDAPWSNAIPSILRDARRPPARRPLSNTATFSPAPCSAPAHANPAMPAPTTATRRKLCSMAQPCPAPCPAASPGFRVAPRPGPADKGAS